MKNKLIIVSVFSAILTMSTLFALSNTAEAHGYWHGGYRGGCYGCGWVAPAIIGGAIGYELAQPRYYTPPPVYYTPPPSVVYVQPQALPQSIPPGYHWQAITDPATGQLKMALIPD